MQRAVITYLLNQLLGTGLTPQQLMQEAACFDKCIPPGMQEEIQTWLLCQIANGPGVGFQDALLRLTPAMTNGLGGSGITLALNSSSGPFTGTGFQYLGTLLANTFSVTAAGAPNVVTIDFPNLVTILSGAFSMNVVAPSLTTINLPVFVPTPAKTFTWGPAPINAASVNNFLARCVANAAFTAGTINFANVGVSAPTGQGLVDKVTLQGRGVSVNTN